MEIAYIIGTIFSVCSIIGIIWAIKLVFEDSFFGGLIASGVALPLILLVAVLPFLVIASVNSPDLVTLKKDSWHCTAHHNETIMVGKILSTVQVCDQYGRI